MKKVKTITINWNDEKSITKGEKEIQKLINSGWTHEKTISGFNTSSSIYSKK